MKMKATTIDAYKLLHEGALALARAERQGIRIDVDYCERKSKFLTKKIDWYTKKLEASNFYRRWGHIYGKKTKISSDQQLAHMLYNVLKITPPKLTESERGAADEETLRQLAGQVPEVEMILEIRKLKKVRDTYLQAFMREQYDGYIHPFFNLHTVKTYRSSSDKPNFQNIPKRDKKAKEITRRALMPRPGHMLIEADFSSLEVSISACYHKDPVMIKYLNDDSSDMHADMAKQIYMLDKIDKKNIPEHGVLRQSAKNGFVFPQFYGDYYGNNAMGLCEWMKLPIDHKWKPGEGIGIGGGVHISDHLMKHGISNFDSFTEHMKGIEKDFWGNRFKVYNKWREDWMNMYRKKGYFQMHTGFICSGIMGRNEVVNYPVQGSAFHCLLWSFIQMDKIMRKEHWDTKLVGQIHDSIILDVLPDELSHVKETLYDVTTKKLPQTWKWIIVPLKIDIDEYGVDEPWLEKEEV